MLGCCFPWHIYIFPLWLLLFRPPRSTGPCLTVGTALCAAFQQYNTKRRRYSRDKLCFIAVSSARRCIAACRFPSTTGFAVTIDRRGFVGVIFPLMRSKEFLHHPVYISSRCSEYNRGFSVPSHFFVLVSFCSFLPLSNLPKTKTGQCRCVTTYDTTLYRSIRHTLAYRLNDTIRRVGVLLKIIWVILLVQHYCTNIAPASTNHYMIYTNSRPCRGQPYAFVCPPKN